MRGKTLGVIAVVVLGAAAVGYLLLNRATEPPPPMAEVVIPPLPAKPVTPPSVPSSLNYSMNRDGCVVVMVSYPSVSYYSKI